MVERGKRKREEGRVRERGKGEAKMEMRCKEGKVRDAKKGKGGGGKKKMRCKEGKVRERGK